MAAEPVHELRVEFLRMGDQDRQPQWSTLGKESYLLRVGRGQYKVLPLDWKSPRGNGESLVQMMDKLRTEAFAPERGEELGELLRDFLGDAFDIYERFITAWAKTPVADEGAQAELAADRRPQLVLTLCSAAEELYLLPWELTKLKDDGGRLGSQPAILLRYELPAKRPRSTPAAPTAPPYSRILLAWSAAGGQPPPIEDLLDADTRGQLPRDPDASAPSLAVLPNASLGAITAALREAQAQGQPFTVLHLLCHGVAQGSAFGLSLCDKNSRAIPVDGETLREHLKPFAATIKLAILTACDSGNEGTRLGTLASPARLLHGAGFATVVASRYPLSFAGAQVLVKTLYQSLLCDFCSVEGAVLHARDALLAIEGTDAKAWLDWAGLRLYARHEDGSNTRPLVFRPYRGLQAYRPEDPRLFFGRDDESRLIDRKLRAMRRAGRPRLLLLDGSPGVGKLSVVLAGALPLLRQKRAADAPVATDFVLVRPGREPRRALVKALETLDHKSAQPMLLVVDELEELFTLVDKERSAGQARERTEFMQQLWQLASRATPEVTVVITVSSKQLGQARDLIVGDDAQRLGAVLDQPFAGSAKLAPAHQITIQPMTPAQLLQAIEEPARRVGLTLEDELAQRLLSNMENARTALPILSLTLDKLWCRRHGQLLTHREYAAMGGLGGAIATQAEEVYASLAAKLQGVTRALFMRIVAFTNQSEVTEHQPIPRSALRPAQAELAAQTDEVIDAFVRSHLLIRAHDARGSTTIEVAHMLLLRRWARITQWAEETAQELLSLTLLTRLAQRYIERGIFLRGSQLATALYMARDLVLVQPAAAVQALLTASQDPGEEARVTSSELGPGQSLLSGTPLRSANGHYELCCEPDGNLVLRRNHQPQWQSHTHGVPSARLEMQASDGHLVVYDGSGTALWWSGIFGPQHQQNKLTLTDDGALIIVDRAGDQVWSLGGSRLLAGCWLGVNESISSADGRYELRYQEDGDLVLLDGDRRLWHTQTAGQPPDRLEMQAVDGRLCLLTKLNTVPWSSGVSGAGYAGSKLILTEDGALLIKSPDGALVWSLGSNHLLPGRSLGRRDFLRSANGRYELRHEEDGRLTLRVANLELWHLGPELPAVGRWELRAEDGGLVFVDSRGTILWSSSLKGEEQAGSSLVLTDAGSLVLRGPDGIDIGVLASYQPEVSGSYPALDPAALATERQ